MRERCRLARSGSDKRRELSIKVFELFRLRLKVMAR
jgi:hypothetical protein